MTASDKLQRLGEAHCSYVHEFGKLDATARQSME